jgi:hypothetical protein
MRDGEETRRRALLFESYMCAFRVPAQRVPVSLMLRGYHVGLLQATACSHPFPVLLQVFAPHLGQEARIELLLPHQQPSFPSSLA